MVVLHAEAATSIGRDNVVGGVEVDFSFENAGCWIGGKDIEKERIVRTQGRCEEQDSDGHGMQQEVKILHVGFPFMVVHPSSHRDEPDG